MSHNPYRAPLAPGRPAVAAATFTPAAPAPAPAPAPGGSGPAVLLPSARPSIPGGTGDGIVTSAQRRRIRVRRVRAGIGLALVGHGVAVTLPVLPALIKVMLGGPGSDGTIAYVLSAVPAQLALAAVVVVLGIRRTAERDAAGAVGLALGWLAGAPAALLAGIAIAVTIAV
ncbi:hypothetical protein CS0771_26570 [Catellatospora sp. IY07-71]|uniref:hypothetical protein n=1 Tax=Catellatospora sp. IY07-71 TaxID=2728827 RepID=UPI001BB37379|nr:hypothetical protein [Catellatospora sp. IY07-71]BCJ73113.1 hypothetical protein CS0771_26570 [Catellatospora sp. IY07-71]